MLDLSALKSEVKITTLAASIGYKIDKSKGVRNWLTMRSESDEIIINVSKSTQTYFVRASAIDKGTCYDFIKNRLDKFSNGELSTSSDHTKIVYHLSRFAGLGNIELDNFYTPPRTFVLSDYKISPFESALNSYLTTARKISKETLSTFSSSLSYISKNTSGSNFVNIGFPFFAKDSLEVIGYELVNKGFKGFTAGSKRGEALFRFRCFPSRAVKHVFCFESGVDLLSFYDLVVTRGKTYKGITPEMLVESELVDTGGQLTIDQCNYITCLADSTTTIWNCFDNDLMGEIYSVQLYCVYGGLAVEIYKNAVDQVEMHFQGTVYKFMSSEFSFSKACLLIDNRRSRNKVRRMYPEKKDFNEDLKALFD